MSAGQMLRTRSASQTSQRPELLFQPPAPSLTPQQDELQFEPCAATASFFFYSQRNVILCLHHDTLAIERRFDRHREDVSWICADNVSDRGAGRMVVSYDTGNTAIVWDLMTGDEVARFASYEEIRVAAWMKNGNVAFGNSQGNVILFEPATSEHISARTIFDPITALAPGADCRTFAIGYLNGSILVAALQPSFTILHTLTTPRQPSTIQYLAWHGSSAKQKSEMLAALTADGDLRVWSIPKPPSSDSPCVIRILNRSETREPGPSWFGWSKNGRIIQHSEGQTLAWDVRTKKVSYETVPTLDGVTAIANHGPSATLFTLGRNHTVQQYDLNPNNAPMLVANAQHVPANAPPSPPNSIEEQKAAQSITAGADDLDSIPALPVYLDSDASEGEGVAMSPLQRIAQEMDQLEEERRDRVGPLSPVSSRESISSVSSSGRRRRRYAFEKSHPKISSGASDSGTEFSLGSSVQTGRDSVSIRTKSSVTSSRYRTSSLRKEVTRSLEEPEPAASTDLFPYAKARLRSVPFRTPQYSKERTADDLRQQMLSVVFGWDHDIEALIRDEVSRHTPGSASGVLLSKWLGDLSTDMMSNMIGSELMTSSDWMLLALSSIGADSQKKVGLAFVQRLLEKGDVHSAIAILIGLGEHEQAIEAYVSRKYFMEAVLLTCLLFPGDWPRQSHLVRKWGEVAVGQGHPELAVRCFSCTSLESSEPMFSSRPQPTINTQQLPSSFASPFNPPLSPPSAGPSRMKNSALKLITNFGDKAAPQIMSTTDEQTPMNIAIGVTPIAESALSPGGARDWLRPSARGMRDPASAISTRTATPGAYGRRRMPSRSDPNREVGEMPLSLVPQLESAIPQSAIEPRRALEEILPQPQRAASADIKPEEAPILLSAVAYDPNQTAGYAVGAQPLPSPAPGLLSALQSQTSARNGSRDRKPDGLSLHLQDAVEFEGPPSALTSIMNHQVDVPSPASTHASLKSSKIRSIDDYISSLEEANHYAKQQRAASRQRGESRDGRGRSSRTGHRDLSETRGRSSTRYIRPAKRSPSSPVPMSPEDAALYSSDSNTSKNAKKDAPVDTQTYDDERYYKVPSPTESTKSEARGRSGRALSKARSSSKLSRRAESIERLRGSAKPASRAASRAASRNGSPDRLTLNLERGRSKSRGEGSLMRSPSSPLPMSSEARFYREDFDAEMDDTASERLKSGRSSSRRSGSRATSRTRREVSPDRLSTRERSRSRRSESRTGREAREPSPERPLSRQSNRVPKLRSDISEARGMSRKELAARELEERRLSLARRPSAPIIPHPDELTPARTPLGARSVTDLTSSSSYSPAWVERDRIARSQTVDPDAMMRLAPATSTAKVPIGLPATPRAMRHPLYMSVNPNELEGIPAVPELPSSHLPHSDATAPVTNAAPDDAGPLLPSTVYGQPSPQAPARAASAPPEKFRLPMGRRGSTSSRGHSRQGPSGEINYKRISPPIASIDATLAGDEHQVVIIQDQESAPPILAELQHLAGPPPPPPPPLFPLSSAPGHSRGNSTSGSLGVINIAIDDHPRESRSSTPVIEVPPPPAAVAPVVSPPVVSPPVVSPPAVQSPPATQTSSTAASPPGHRRGRGSVSEIGSRLRHMGERMRRDRSSSRSRAKSPPIDTISAPYESLLPPILSARLDGQMPRSMSPPQSAPYESIPPPPPPPPPPPASGATGPLIEQVVPPDNPPRSGSAFSGYRNPKEIRANMPPESLQLGVVQPVESGMI